MRKGRKQKGAIEALVETSKPGQGFRERCPGGHTKDKFQVLLFISPNGRLKRLLISSFVQSGLES